MSNSTPKSQVSDRLRDGRDAGEWESSYNWRAIIQIYVELAYLLGLLFISIYVLYNVMFGLIPSGLITPEAITPSPGTPGPSTPPISDQAARLSSDQAYWIAVALGGLIGGVVFALKWHYHSVAKRIWHQDRLVWRITAPILSGVLATFVIMMIRSDIIPLISVEKLTSIYAATSFSFFLGLFSDNLLASLQNLAAQMFGTLKDRGQTDVRSADAGAEAPKSENNAPSRVSNEPGA